MVSSFSRSELQKKSFFRALQTANRQMTHKKPPFIQMIRSKVARRDPTRKNSCPTITQTLLSLAPITSFDCGTAYSGRFRKTHRRTGAGCFLRCRQCWRARARCFVSKPTQNPASRCPFANNNRQPPFQSIFHPDR